MSRCDKYDYEHIFIDNASTDDTVEKLKDIAKNDKNIKLIVNVRNFGHIRSPYYAFFQASGKAIVAISADLQDPPSLIPEFINKWEEGYKVVLGVKNNSEEPQLIFALRSAYYRTLAKLSDVKLVENFSGFGLYDRDVIDILRKIDDPYPYFRGLIADLGFENAQIPYFQTVRQKGITKNNILTLYDLAMLGLTSYSKMPLRLATLLGFFTGFISFLIGVVYLIYKLLFWENFSVGLAPVVVGIFFFSSIQLFFLGIVGEYVGSIYTKVTKRPLVIEKERINF
jgi:glycosyltransferase involved in cell wall biosynthesis